jgi:hypothetical protein
VIVLVEIVCLAGLCICKGQDDIITNVFIREIPQQTVLYTVYRGDYYMMGDAINELYALANSRGIKPCGEVSTCCLNSPIVTDSSQMLVEIQIPVENTAIEKKGTLGAMTDIKILPPMKVAVAVKPEGCNDPTSIINDLFSWVNKKDYVVIGRMRQTIMDGGRGSYHKLRTEFILPVDSIHNKSRITLTTDPCYM